MKRLATISLLIISLVSCNKSKDLEGTWIEIDNYNNPAVFKYWDGKFYQFDGIYQDTVKYRIVGNNLIYEKHGKASFKITNDTLAFTFDSVNYPFKLERLTFKTYYDYLMSKLKVELELPSLQGKEIDYTSNNNFITLSKYNDSIKFSFNGKFYNLNDFSLNAEYDWHRKVNLFYIDSTIKIDKVTYLENVFDELGLNIVAYVSENKDSNGIVEINGLKRFIPISMNHRARLKDTLEEEVMFISEMRNPTIERLSQTDEFVYYESKNNSIQKNGNDLNYNELENDIKNQIIKNKDFVLSYFVNDSSSYADFLRFYSALNKPYNEIRDSISILKYKQNFEELDSENRRTITKLYPKRIWKLSNRDMEYIKNNP